jgi:hypothetical protein
MSQSETHIRSEGFHEIAVDCPRQVRIYVHVDEQRLKEIGQAELVLRFTRPNERSDDLKEVRVPLPAVRAAIAAAGL